MMDSCEIVVSGSKMTTAGSSNEMITTEAIKEDIVMEAKTSQENTTDTHEADKTSLNNASCIRFRNYLFELAEELRVCRISEVEYEEKIKELIQEKNHIENRYDDILASNKQIVRECEEKLSWHEKQFGMKEKELEGNKMKYTILTETFESQTKDLKEAVRNAKHVSYRNEKKIKDLERMLQQQSSAKDESLKQMAELEQKVKDLTEQLTQLGEDQDRLGLNVKEAVKINNSLAKVNAHKCCEIHAYTSQVERLEKELLEARVELNSLPSNHVAQLAEEERRVKILQEKLETEQSLAASVKTELDIMKKEKQMCTATINDCHDLLSRHVDSNNKLLEEIAVYKEKISEWEKKYQQLKLQYDEKTKALTDETETKERAEEQWQKENEAMQGKLQQLKKELDVIIEKCKDHESMNKEWHKKNNQLKEELKKMDLELNKPKSEQITQTETLTQDISVQAVQDNKHVAVGTVEEECASVSVQAVVEQQTSSAQWDISMSTNWSQTHHPKLVVTGTQYETLAFLQDVHCQTEPWYNDEHNLGKNPLVMEMETSCDKVEEDTQTRASQPVGKDPNNSGQQLEGSKTPQQTQTTNRDYPESQIMSEINKEQKSQSDKDLVLTCQTTTKQVKSSPKTRQRLSLKTVSISKLTESPDIKKRKITNTEQTLTTNNEDDTKILTPVTSKSQQSPVATTFLSPSPVDHIDIQSAFRFLHLPEIRTNVTESGVTPNQNEADLPTNLRQQRPASIMSTGIAGGSRGKRVQFAAKLEQTPPTSQETCIRIRQAWEQVGGEFSNGPKEQKDMSLGEESLFSEDEDGIELGSQVEKIHSNLQ